MSAREDSDIMLALGEAARDASAINRALAQLGTQMQARTTLYAAQAEFGGAPMPRPACFDALRPDRVYGGAELADRAAPFDPDFSRGDSRVIAAQAPRLWLWLHRARGGFRAADSARLSALMPHIAQAVALGQERAALERARDDALALLWRAGLGRIGPDGPDATAARLLAEAGLDPPVMAPGTLHLLPGGITAYGPPGGDVLLRAPRDLPAAAQLARALGLTLSEARLARALGAGLALPQASARLGLTRETGRSYAKQVYAKTGVTGQSGLVRLLWGGVLAFG